MHTRRALGIVTTAAVAAAVSLGIALPSAGARVAAPIVVFGRLATESAPTCPPASRPGAVLTLTEHLYSPTDVAVGYTSEVTTATQRLPGAICDIVGETELTLRLPAGTITAGGLFYPYHSPNTLAVLGGTGAYSGASGEVAVVVAAQNGNRYTITLR